MVRVGQSLVRHAVDGRLPWAKDVPQYDPAWGTLGGTDRFLVKGVLYGAGNINVALALVFEGRVLMYHADLVFDREHLDPNDYRKVAVKLEKTAEKFNKLYPLHFLAKEWDKSWPTR